jgi:cytoskeleton protein RodZ
VKAVVSGFGDKFRTARELRGIGFSEIAQQTRISARFLRAIETEAFGELPGGLFNRGFVRTYAEAVGLDPDTMVEEYTALTQKAEPAESETPPPTPSASRERYVLPAVAGALLVLTLIVYAGWHGAGSEQAPVPGPGAEAVPPTLSAGPSRLTMPTASPTLAETADSGTADSGVDALQTAIQATAEAPVTSGAAIIPPAQNATLEETATVAPEEPAIEGIVAATPAPVAPPERPPVPVASATPESNVPVETAVLSPGTEPVTVRVELRDSSWMYIELDGELQYEKNINPPFWRNYTVTEALELKIGNPAGAVLSVNGQPVPSPGPSDEVWSLTITPENASSLTGSL